MSRFVFVGYDYDAQEGAARFHYAFEDTQEFTETVVFEQATGYNEALLDRALFLAFIVIGTSYYKAFASREVVLSVPIDAWQAHFFSMVYQEGLGQFAFENQLTRDDLARFVATTTESSPALSYEGEGVMVLQSGGKDSLLLAALLRQKKQDFTPWYVASGPHYPQVLDLVGGQLVKTERRLDRKALLRVADQGGKNGHVPVTYIVQSLAVIQVILLGKRNILTAIAHEGEEPDHVIGDLVVTHQWSKTWQAEQLFSEYIARYVTPNIQIGSPLRGLSELRVAELFVEHAWADYRQEFSSCNVANYRQGGDNSRLVWCGACPKCANSYLLFAPFVAATELQQLFHGQDLFAKESLAHTFKGLLGIDEVSKPFECIGEIDELRFAYHLAQAIGGYQPLPFSVPESSFEYTHEYPSQRWAQEMLQ